MKALRITKLVVLAAAALLVIGFLHFNLPRTAVVSIEGTDIKRAQKTDRKSGDKVDPDAKTVTIRDVRYINTLTRDNKIFVLRNEDTSWGWPPYFKFDSADIHAKAQAFAKADPAPSVLVKFYGWRLQMFSMFPNIISMKEVNRDYSHFPLFNVVFLVLFFGGLLFVALKLKGIFERIKARFFPKKKSPPGKNGATP
ncbi:MAG: DUF1523 family protein [Desulfosarcina sp.]|nr:DUF1523 family protein [Desulfobacterales bacterium]